MYSVHTVTSELLENASYHKATHTLYNGNARRTYCTTRQGTPHMLYNRKLINGRIGGRCGRFEEPPLKSGKVDAFLLSDLYYTL